MENVEKIINSDEVISINDKENNVLINHHTYKAYKAEEFLSRLGEHIDRNKKEKWIDKCGTSKILG